MSLMALDDALKQEDKRTVVYPTGSFMLNLAIGEEDPNRPGVFGIPSGTIFEVFGWNQTGKTLLAETLMASVLAYDDKKEVIFISTEKANKKRIASYIPPGVKKSRVKIWEFDRTDKEQEANPLAFRTIEAGLDLALEEVRTNPNIAGVIFDTVKASVCLKDTSDGKTIKDMDDKDIPAIRARLIEKFLLKWLAMNNANAWLCMLNQLSESIGPDYVIGGAFKIKTPGGRFMESQSQLRIKCDSVKLEDDKDHPLTGIKPQTGFEFYYTVVKNKFAPSTGHRRAKSIFYFETKNDPARIATEHELLNMAVFLDLAEVKKGGHYTFIVPAKGKDKELVVKAHGEDKALDEVRFNPRLNQYLREEAIAHRHDIFRSKEGPDNRPTAKKILGE